MNSQSTNTGGIRIVGLCSEKTYDSSSSSTLPQNGLRNGDQSPMHALVKLTFGQAVEKDRSGDKSSKHSGR